MGYVLTGLTQYTEEHRLPLIGKSVLGAKSAKIFNLMTDVKGPTALNKFNTEVIFGDGSSCGWSASGNTEFSQRILTPTPLKVNMSYCDKDMLKYWAQYQVQVAVGAKTLPFEEDLTNSIADNVAEKIEKMIYQGVSGQTNEFEGMISILESASGETNNVSSASGTTAYAFLKAVAKAIPTAVKEKGDAVILCSAGVFDEFIDNLVTANLYHYNPDNDGESYMLPATNVKVIKVNGLNGASDSYEYAIGGRLANLFYGTDAEGDDQKFEIWKSQDYGEFRLAIEFIAGVQVAYPNEIAFGKLAL